MRILTRSTIVAVILIIGCSQKEGKVPDEATAPKNNASESTAATTESKDKATGQDHSGWWCIEHGVPEEICAQCDSKVAAEFKKNGDWCKHHDRPKSQCFLCNPAAKETFANQYRAKYGKEPPPIEDEVEAGVQKGNG